MPDPLYVEVTPLLYPELTGVGRLVARLIEALGQRVPLRLFTAIQGDLVPKTHAAEVFPAGHELAVARADLPRGSDADLSAWVRRLLDATRQPLETELARRCATPECSGWSA